MVVDDCDDAVGEGGMGLGVVEESVCGKCADGGVGYLAKGLAEGL